METIPLAGPWITEREIEYVTDAVKTAWYGNAEKYHQKFEKKFADYLGVRYALSLPSCTSAIHLALLALQIGPGDEVIVPDITWIATAAPITYVGATVVFADIDPTSWCLSAASLEECITPKTRAVIPVDLYGNMSDMDAMAHVTKRYGIAIIEDAAEAIGSEYNGKKAGCFGEIGVFSFHGSKTVTTGEGGMLVTHRKKIYDRALFLSRHGRKPADRLFYNQEVAYKYKMSNLQAALGLAQLERIEELVKQKRTIFAWYREALKGENIQLNSQPPGTKNSYFMVTALLNRQQALQKETVIEKMAQKRINCRPFFYPLSSLPAFQDRPEARKARYRNKVSYQISPYGINLPSGFDLTEENVKRVSNVLKEILRKDDYHRRR